MDSRVDPFRIFGLAPGEAHVIRSAGGSVTDDVMRSVAASQWGLNTTEVLVLHHTRCGMAGVDDDALSAAVEEETGAAPPFRFGGFSNVDDDVRAGMARIRAARYLRPGTEVRGFVYDLDTGAIVEVDPRG
jgi:carbonic anhydrase